MVLQSQGGVSTSSLSNIDLSNLSETGENHFANLEASNFSAIGLDYLSGLSMPDISSKTNTIEFSIGESGSDINIPANGWFKMSLSLPAAGSCSAGIYHYNSSGILVSTLWSQQYNAKTTNGTYNLFLPVPKNSIVRYFYANGSTNIIAGLVYAIGSNPS